MNDNTIDLGKMRIVLPENAAVVEQSAAAELQEHICKLCSSQLPIIKENEAFAGEGAIYVGATRFAAAHCVTFPDNAFGEGWAIKAAAGSLILCGGQTRGVLYAVYHLLEDVFGVRWWNIWEEYIPSLPAALVPANYERSGVPAMEYRDAFFWPTETDSRFAVRNRMNGFATRIPSAFGGMEDFGPPAHVHTFDRYFPEVGSQPGDVGSDWANALNPEKESYLKTHPEWFAMTERGKRVPKILCMSDEGLQKAFAEKLIKSIGFSYAQADAAGKPRPRYFDLSPADMPGECRCPRCAESIRLHGSSGHQVIFANKMAEAVKKVYPEAIVETISYGHYLTPPLDDTKPSADVAIRYCNSAMDILHDIHHPNNKQYLDGLTTWVNLCAKGKLYLWDYGVYYNANGIIPSMYKLQDNFRTFAQLGVNGYFLEIEQCITTDFWDMKVWMSTKLMEDPYLDVDLLLDTFLNGYYGPAAPHIRRHLDAAHRITEEKVGNHGFGSTSLIYAEGFTAEDILFADSCFEQAFQAAGNDPVLLRRLRIARMGLDRVIVENFAKWQAEAKQKQITLTFDKVTVGRRICQTLTEQIALRGDWDPFGAEALKQYEKYLPDYVPPQEKAAESEEARLSKIHGCKDGWRGISPVVADEEELNRVPKDCLYVFSAGIDFAAEADPDSPIGKSGLFDIPYKHKARILPDEVIQEKWAVTDTDAAKCIPVGVYTGELDSNGSPLSAVWGTIRASDIVADGKYHLYKFPDVVAVAKDHGGTFHMFRDWGLLIHTFSWELGFLEGKKVDCYVSMKVTGDVTCSDGENLPIYNVDRIIVADKTQL